MVSRIARRHHKSLSGLNFYANKMANMRAEATNEFARLSGKSVGDTSALAELMQTVFSSTASAKSRGEAARELQFALKTAWAGFPADQSELEEGGVFPLVTLNQTKRGYLVAVGKQMNGCYASGWHDGCAVMMRRLLESAIIEAFEAKGIDHKIKDAASGDFFQLSSLIHRGPGRVDMEPTAECPQGLGEPSGRWPPIGTQPILPRKKARYR